MIASARQRYNQSFSESRYQEFLNDLDRSAGLKISFRVAESPVFIDRHFRKKLMEASAEVIKLLQTPDVKDASARAVPDGLSVPNETDHTLFLALDFAVVKDDLGGFIPQLIELQGFPSLFGWQDFLPNKFREHFAVPKDFQNHFVSQADYQAILKKAILGNEDPEHVVLLEIDPLKQNTAVDFLITEKMFGVKPVHIGDVVKEGRKLFYKRGAQRVPIHRIYNRVIFDELVKRSDLQLSFTLTDEVNVRWAGHPNWFFKISKVLMPHLKSRFVPPCYFLSELTEYPPDLNNYVLKPLYSFSGSGVVFNVTREDLDAIPVNSRTDFILQRKVQYEPVIQAPDGLVKAEIRLMFIWEEGKPEPTLVTNLARLSRGEMIGVKYNKDKTWVGGTVCFFEP